MKKLIFPIVCCFISITVSAQLVKQEAETQKKQSELDCLTVLSTKTVYMCRSKQGLRVSES